MPNVPKFSPEEETQFKGLFRKYCQKKMADGLCGADDCEFCAIDKAYNEIFNTVDEDDDE